jgi:hypothetical protein
MASPWADAIAFLMPENAILKMLIMLKFR